MMRIMANMFDYISWRGDLTFEQSPFNPVDNIIFSHLVYLPLNDIVPGPDVRGGMSIAGAAEQIAQRQRDDPSFLDDQIVVEAAALVHAMGMAPRYKNCQLCGFADQTDLIQEKQFCAVSVVIGKKILETSLLVVYRGTDVNLVGWKEDFNMSLSEPVPSQREAVNYLERMAGRTKGPLRLAGHSKGGNLAIFAAARCRKETKRRIVAVYSNDAPGFHQHFLESQDYQAIHHRIVSFVPQSSLVGMLFKHGKKAAIVQSTETGLKQHDLCTWEVMGNDLVRADELSRESILVNNILRDWINEMENEQRRRFIEAIYTIVTANHARSISDLSSDWLQSIVSIINSLKNIDEPTKKLIGKSIGDLFWAARKNIATLREK